MVYFYRASAFFLVALVAAATTDEVCNSPQCAVMEDSRQDMAVDLLQVAAKGKESGSATSKDGRSSTDSTRPAAPQSTADSTASIHSATTAPAALNSQRATVSASASAAAKGNATAGRAVMHNGVEIGRTYGKQGACDKLTGGTCMLGECDESRSAMCGKGLTGMPMCVCSDYMCVNGAGSCEFSVSEVAAAVGDGVYGVADQVTSLANSIPGVADAISGISGLAGTAGQVMNEAIGWNSGCARTVSTCMFSGCDASVESTADCSYGVCSCKNNFCYSSYNGKSYCTFDINSISEAVNALR